MKRKEELIKVSQNQEWDFIIIGGGASGLGSALDATTRGFRTLLLESHDFAKATSSRSTKLVHGGVRYPAQGNMILLRKPCTKEDFWRKMQLILSKTSLLLFLIITGGAVFIIK